MKYLHSIKSIFLTLFLCSIFISCSDEDGGDDVTPVDPLDTQANALNGTYEITDVNSVSKDGTIVDVFTSMTLTISGGSASGGSYSTLNSDSDEIWPSSGTWTFQNGDKNKILRSDGVSMSISLTEYNLLTSFNTTGGIKDGTWAFLFTKQ
jgi:hypothetical protein